MTCTIPKYLRGCLKKTDKIANFIALWVISFSGTVKSRDFERYIVWLGLYSLFLRVPRPKYMMPIHENLEFSIFQKASKQDQTKPDIESRSC